mmetsp:Transcript_28816/g.81188  ORF Transcript_28816/g.81188 Transcript_28816/m.81188 type:complete len:180 (+) Transcript_28816:155-694(+)
MSSLTSCRASAPLAAAATERSVSCRRSGAAAAPLLAASPLARLQPRGGASLSAKRASSVKTPASRPVVAAVAAEAETLPAGYVRYETMLVLRPNITDEERDRELAKFEFFLKNEEAVEINAVVRGRQRMAYPMQGHWEGIYVLYTYGAKRQTAKGVQKMLSTPDIESEGYLLRFMTFVV